MKKLMILVCALLCANHLYGMEPQEPNRWNLLPQEVQVLVLQALSSSNNPDEAIRTIRAAGRTNKALNQLVNETYFNNLKGFTALMDLLAKKFPMSRKIMAQTFGTPTAMEYIKLGEQLFWPANTGFSDKSVEDIKALLNKGADPNYSGGQTGDRILESTYLAVLNASSKENKQYKNGVTILNLLLHAGAKPSADFMLNEQQRVNKGTTPAKLRSKLFALLQQYTGK